MSEIATILPGMVPAINEAISQTKALFGNSFESIDLPPNIRKQILENGVVITEPTETLQRYDDAADRP